MASRKRHSKVAIAAKTEAMEAPWSEADVEPLLEEGGFVKFNVRKIGAGGTGESVSVIKSNLGLYVDSSCAVGPQGSIPGRHISNPVPRAMVTTACTMDQQGKECSGLMSMESLDTAGEIDTWKRRLLAYMEYPTSLPISAAWVCSSKQMWYGIPGFKSRGAGDVGFVATKPLPQGEWIVSLANFVLSGGSPTSGMIGALFNYISEFTPGFTWARSEERFINEAGLREMLSDTVLKTGGVVPGVVSASSVGVILGRTAPRCVLLPLPVAQIKLLSTDPDATDAWITNTMRSLWFEIVNEVQYARGVYDYRPSYPVREALLLFAGGVATGAGVTFYGGPNAVIGRVGEFLTQNSLKELATRGIAATQEGVASGYQMAKEAAKTSAASAKGVWSYIHPYAPIQDE